MLGRGDVDDRQRVVLRVGVVGQHVDRHRRVHHRGGVVVVGVGRHRHRHQAGVEPVVVPPGGEGEVRGVAAGISVAVKRLGLPLALVREARIFRGAEPQVVGAGVEAGELVVAAQVARGGGDQRAVLLVQADRDVRGGQVAAVLDAVVVDVQPGVVADGGGLDQPGIDVEPVLVVAEADQVRGAGAVRVAVDGVVGPDVGQGVAVLGLRAGDEPEVQVVAAGGDGGELVEAACIDGGGGDEGAGGGVEVGLEATGEKAVLAGALEAVAVVLPGPSFDPTQG